MTRKVEEESESTEMVGVEHLGQYVFEMTKAKVASLKEGREVLPVVEDVNGRDGEEEDEDAPGQNVMEEVEADGEGDVALGEGQPEEQD